jgi:hypothetical protein
MKKLEEAIANAKKVEAAAAAGQAADMGTDLVKTVKGAEEIIAEVLDYEAPADISKDEKYQALRRKMKEFRRAAREARAKYDKK